MPVILPATGASEITTSPALVVVTAAPDGVPVAAWLLRMADWSSGAAMSAPENSQITAAAPVTVTLGVMVNVVAPDALFRAYQTSATDPVIASTDRAAPASTYAFPALSVILAIVTAVLMPPPPCQPTTIRLPLPVAGIVHVDAGKVCEPQEVTWTRLMAGSPCVRLTVQLLEAPELKLAGLQLSDDICPGASRLIAAVCELPPNVAVTVAIWLLAMVAAAVAPKAAVAAPAATVTVAGTMSEMLLLESVTEEPPVGAAWVSVTVHVLTALWPRLVGMQASEEICSGATRLMVAVCELLL
jgi:hypothetical protein